MKKDATREQAIRAWEEVKKMYAPKTYDAWKDIKIGGSAGEQVIAGYMREVHWKEDLGWRFSITKSKIQNLKSKIR